MEKQVSIVVAASGEVKDVALSPGATVSEVLNEAGLQGYQLSRKGGEPLSPDTDLYEEANESEKLYATPQDVSVGDGGSASFSRFPGFMKITSNLIKHKSLYDPYNSEELKYFRIKKVRVTGSRYFKPLNHSITTLSKVRRRPEKAKIMETSREYPYWQEQGWIKFGGEYRGHYKTSHGRWRGLIRENFTGDYSFYIFNPPGIMRDSVHWDCLQHKGNGRYWIHFSNKPRDVSSGIIAVEKLITNSFRQDRNGGGRCFSDGRDIKEFIFARLKRI